MNDLRLMVNCFKAIEYWSDTDGESYLDSEGLELKRRLERLYLEELKGSPRWSFEAQMPAFLDSDR